jgi:hypothetical protein
MSKIKVIILIMKKSIAHVIEIPIQLVKLLFLTTQLIILLKWQQQLVPPYFQKTGKGMAMLA